LSVFEQRRRQAAQRRPRQSIWLDVSVALALWLSSSPEHSSRSALNRRMSAARRSGSGVETTSPKAVRNPPASVSGNPIRSSSTCTGRHIATGSPPPSPRSPTSLIGNARGRFRSRRRQITSAKASRPARAR
jgi:hypothetical protein